MTVADLVERAIKAQAGRAFAEAQCYYLAAILVALRVPAERFDELIAHDLVAPRE